MMELDEFRKIAAREKVSVAMVEKDYILTIILAIISQLPLVNRMAFKGGTAIKKLYFPTARFSEDLDFTCFGDISSVLYENLQKTIQGRNVLNINFKEIISEKSRSGTSARITVRYLDYNGHLTNIRLDLNIGEKPSLKTSLKILPDNYEIGKSLTCAYLKFLYKDIHGENRYGCELSSGEFQSKIRCLTCADFLYDSRLKQREELTNILVRTMDLEEILAEKVRALMERKLPRDLYDIWFLIKNDVKADVGLINRKLQMYNKKLEFAEFQEVISQVKLAWERDLSPLLPMIPNFDTLRKEVMEKLFP